jgi:hypothetical protein
MFSLVTPFPVVQQNNSITPTEVAWHVFPRRKCCPTWQILPHHMRWHDNKRDATCFSMLKMLCNVADLATPHAFARQGYLVASTPLAQPKGLYLQFF